MSTHSHADAPAKLLADWMETLPRGKALDIAMGKGRNALYLADGGFEVEGLDRDDEAVRACEKAADLRGLKISARKVDLESYRLPSDRYDLIICFYYLQRSLIPQMREALRPGGFLLYETFLIDHHLQFGRPKHREYCFEHNELLNFFRSFRVLFYREGMVEDRTIAAQILAQKGG